MATLQEKIDELTRQVSVLAAQQTHFGKQLLALMNELDALKKQAAAAGITATKEPVPEKVIEYTEPIIAPSQRPVQAGTTMPKKESVRPSSWNSNSKSKTSFEEFIGKNLASKVGILVTIIGIFIGARYAIEHDLVSPVVRILCGYASGLVLVGIALRLKKKYETYSAVLMGGGLSVLYFITYIAWSFYTMLPQVAAFGLMLLFTAAIVYAAVLYDKVIIAHLGQVGAYAIPFLLSNNSGRYEILFSYITIINVGILVLSFYKYWKSLFHVAYVATWLIYCAWYLFEYNEQQHFSGAFGFLSAFFILFYATFLAYKLIRKEQYNIGDVFLLLSNAFLFYGLGYDLLSNYATMQYWAGLFTVINALIHLGVSLVIKRRMQQADKPLYYMIFGLVVVFLTIAIPVQLDGNWVTLLWTAEAVLLFVIGRTRHAPIYEKLAAGLVLLSFVSLIQDRANIFQPSEDGYPFRNITFYTGVLEVLVLGIITWVNYNKKWQIAAAERTQFHAFFDYIVPALLLITSYSVFYLELRDELWLLENSVETNKKLVLSGNEFGLFTTAILFLYMTVYGILFIYINQRFVRNRWLATVSPGGVAVVGFLLLMYAMPALNRLTTGYFEYGSTGSYFGGWHLVIRYLAIALVALLLTMGTRIMKQYVSESILQQAWWLMVYTIVLGVVSYEYINWVSVAVGEDQYEIGLSIIWGLFALGLVSYGIRKKQKYVRLAAIVLFVITILKLFIYDLAGAGTLTKTISFISLGIILLLVSFLYNKYKEVLFGDDKAEVGS
ncbi:DUF2339 domain-containing protein [Pseudoflavitalea sp. X16]|uniref:DUF2339 domain-containing protein n=1 Tax=Paraflavitalea devenefica TaxID=2716334 RepID=UPI00141DC707|nr:DUF2339 domain-containing protein [Paraflavitalea devenefica]NII27462.1 DUF2339 domain-containing protein [Paraflavitalea devenefica]